jgi:hypothetical protein
MTGRNQDRTRDPYALGIVPPQPFAAKLPLCGQLVAVLRVTFERRGLELEPVGSRAFPDGAIAELAVTDEPDAQPGKTVQRAAYLGFVRFPTGGLVIVGEACSIDGEKVGVVAGFDTSHEPNHLNIVVRADRLAHGAERGLTPGQTVEFKLTA